MSKPLLHPRQLHDYQRNAISFMLSHHYSMLWLQMGLGKTPVTLTAIVDRMRAGFVKKTLIFGPLRVIRAVWDRECLKWEHTKHLRCSIIAGNKEERTRALFADADIYLCNYESMNWLAETLMHYYITPGRPFPFEMVVYDEVSKLKNSTTKRMKGGTRDIKDGWGTTKVNIVGWKKIIPYFKYRIGLTGTPASNGYLDLHGQYLALDMGERLGETITQYKNWYFQSDHMGWSYAVTENGKKIIESKIADITIKMDAVDHLNMPKKTVSTMFVQLPEKARKAYEDVERQLFTTLDNGGVIEVMAKNCISNKCLQFCNGSPYLNSMTDQYEELHDAKLDALEEVLEEAAGSPVLCSYSYKSDAARIVKHFTKGKKKYNVVDLTAAPSSQTKKIIEDWNSGKIHLLIGHPASMGHGIDGLQDSGSVVVWFGLNWSLELYEQMNARIDRQGQKKPVSIIHILAENTVDMAVADALARKDNDQAALKTSIDRYRAGVVTKEYVADFKPVAVPPAPNFD
jgi:SNF2 family DNA or RNA helicase